MSAAIKYRKKPVVVEAIQFEGTDESSERVRAWVEPDAAVVDTKHIEHLWDYGVGAYVMPNGKVIFAPFETHCLIVLTLEGEMVAAPGWWIIRGVRGELYPCKPDIFEATYEAVAHD